jgi:hypothetical protein
MTSKGYFRLVAHILCLSVVLAGLVSFASAEWKEKVVYSFQGGTDGATPAGGVVFDKTGNLYGATTDGGSACPSPGCGMVFQLAPPSKKGGAWTETILHGFSGSDGSQPAGSVIVDANGNLYGTTAYGGSGTCILLGSNVGCGIVYELSPPAKQGGSWTYTVLYNFQGGKDGQYPGGDLVFDGTGNLYGATVYGGGYGTCNAPYFQYCGTIFKLNPPKKKGGQWKETVLHSFKGITNGQQVGDGANPNGGLVLDGKGAVYGTTYIGGYNCPHNSGNGCGTLFKLTPWKEGGRWTEKIMHRFKATSDGANPAAGMTFDGNGYLYGTSDITIFRMAPPKIESGAWRQTILYTFNSNAYDPEAAPRFDERGNLYGTTNVGSGGSRRGNVFRLKPPSKKGGTWNLGVIHGFTGIPDGENPNAGLILDKAGNFYSTTQYGGTGLGCSFTGCGTVFEVKPQ